jgi:hypothetical protein
MRWLRKMNKRNRRKRVIGKKRGTEEEYWDGRR